jgi:hypothetical protein
VAATTLAALLVSAQKKGLSGGESGLAGILEEIQGKGLEGAELFEYFGTAEAVKAFDTINLNRDKYDQALAEINVAAENNVAAARIALPNLNPTVQAVNQKKQAEAAYEASAEDRGTSQNLVAASVGWRKSRMGGYEAGFFEAVNVADAVGHNILGAIMGDEDLRERMMLSDYLQQGMKHRRAGLDFVPAETKQERDFQLKALDRYDQLGEKLSAAAESFRAAAQQQSQHTHSARLAAQGARAD